MPTVDSYRAQVQDKLYYQDDSVRDTIQKSDDGIAGERKFIGFQSQLLSLFQQCHSCGVEIELKTSIVGTMLVVDGAVLALMDTCYTGSHNQQQIVSQLSILLCGLTFTSIANLADVLNLVSVLRKAIL